MMTGTGTPPTLPEPIKETLGGSSAMVYPWQTRKEAPSIIFHTARVTINAGMPIRETAVPVNDPILAPTRSITAIGPAGKAVVPVIIEAARIMAIRAIPPTERSMPPVKMTKA